MTALEPPAPPNRPRLRIEGAAPRGLYTTGDALYPAGAVLVAVQLSLRHSVRRLLPGRDGRAEGAYAPLAERRGGVGSCWLRAAEAGRRHDGAVLTA